RFVFPSAGGHQTERPADSDNAARHVPVCRREASRGGSGRSVGARPDGTILADARYLLSIPLRRTGAQTLCRPSRPHADLNDGYRYCDVVSPRYHRGMSATKYMRRCLELAELAARAGDTAVGALVVCGGKIVAEGVERTRATRDPSAHAEVEAIRQARQHLDTLDLRGCSPYTTVQPCVLCGYAIRRTGITHVVYGMPAGQAGACTSSYAILADRDLEGWPQVPEVTGGLLADECLAALQRTND